MAVHPCHWASCRTTCSSDKALFEHLLQVHGPPWQHRDVRPDQRLACQWAGCRTQPNRARLRDHLITHTDYRPLVCNVSPDCTMRFKTRRALDLHVNNHRPPTAPCEWKACTEMLADPPALLDHISKVHSSKGGEDICLWTECAHRSALKWKLDCCFSSWYKLILSEEDERGKRSLLHAHMNAASVGTKKRKRKGGSRKKDDAATKGNLDGEHQVEAKPQRAPVLAQDEPDAESDDIAYVDDLKDADYSPGRPTPRRGAKRQREGDWNVDDDYMAPKRNRTAKRLKTHMGESEDESYAPSLSSSSTSAFVTSASTPAVVTPEHEQDYASTTVDGRLAAAGLRIKTLEAQLAAAFSVIRQSDVLRAEWASRMSESADDAGGTAMILYQDPQTTTMEDELSPDDWSLWVTGAL